MKVALRLLLFILTVVAKPGKKKNSTPFEKRLKNRREEIKKTKCNHLGDDFQINCQNYYLSPICFQQAFGEYGMELGELPVYTKENEFLECYKK
jgi:hypothetical protein